MRRAILLLPLLCLACDSPPPGPDVPATQTALTTALPALLRPRSGPVVTRTAAAALTERADINATATAGMDTRVAVAATLTTFAIQYPAAAATARALRP